MRGFIKAGRALAVSAAVLLMVGLGLAGCGGGEDEDEESVMIGGKKWMTKNLNIETADSWCYNNREDNCEKYGRLYTWESANRACPIGWRLPSRDDWDRLAESVGGTKSSRYDTIHDWLGAGKKLKSKNGWKENGNGTDDFGFSALPGGHRYPSGTFSAAGGVGYWWTATDNGSGLAYLRIIGFGSDYVNEDSKFDYGFSVRCVK
jgi:uncharacterized protein (TIGR02145 family)